MISKLDRIVVNEYNSGEQISRLPNNKEIMNKLNDVIDYINVIEKSLTNMNNYISNLELERKVNNMFK